MPGGDRSQKQHPVALRLAQGDTIAEVANDCGVSERTVYRWLHDSDFSALVRQARGSLVGRVLGRAIGRGTEAAEALFQVMEEMGKAMAPPTDGMPPVDRTRLEAARIRLDAAKSILDLVIRGRREIDWEERWQEMEDKRG